MNRFLRAARDLLASIVLGVSAGGLAGIALAAALCFWGAWDHGQSELAFSLFQQGALVGAVLGVSGGLVTGVIGGISHRILGRCMAGVIGWGVAGGIGGMAPMLALEHYVMRAFVRDYSSRAFITGMIGASVGLGIGWVLSRGQSRLPCEASETRDPEMNVS